jgi:hypothetical protein
MSMRFWIEIQKMLLEQKGSGQALHQRRLFWGKLRAFFKAVSKKRA